MKPEWIEYTGSDEQIREILNYPGDVYHRGRMSDGGHFCGPIWKEKLNTPEILLEALKLSRAYEILFCQPHPLADMICQQARTGQPVWLRIKWAIPMNTFYAGDWIEMSTHNSVTIIKSHFPNWHIPGAEYSFTPFEEEV